MHEINRGKESEESKLIRRKNEERKKKKKLKLFVLIEILLTIKV